MRIGSLLLEGIDQIDLTGPFEVLSRLPGAEHRLYGLVDGPVRDVNRPRLLPDAPIEAAPRLDVLHVPGGPGQEALMEDERVPGWLRVQAATAGHVLSVCTGALLLGAAGLLRGRRATTHWTVFHLLPCSGAIPVDRPVVTDASWVFAAGVTAGIDGALGAGDCPRIVPRPGRPQGGRGGTLRRPARNQPARLTDVTSAASSSGRRSPARVRASSGGASRQS